MAIEDVIVVTWNDSDDIQIVMNALYVLITLVNVDIVVLCINDVQLTLRTVGWLVSGSVPVEW